MGVEIERKYLVDPVKWADADKGTGVFMVQGYMFNEPDKSIRIRISGDQAFITIKYGSNSISRTEFEYNIPVSDARAILMAAGPVIEKTRYKIQYLGKSWDVDQFHGINSGLLMAEIELSTEDEEFEKPIWINEEVTGDSRYYNANLVKRG